MFNYGNANEAQKEAISATDGLVLITAGPGTGKTFTLVKRAVYLIQECGIKPEQIMMATFTERVSMQIHIVSTLNQRKNAFYSIFQVIRLRKFILQVCLLPIKVICQCNIMTLSQSD